MKEMPCFCVTFSSLLQQMVKAYKYMTGIFSVTHTSEQQASDCDKQPTKMDVSLLEEQYDHIKQKQKLQSHIIVFKTGMLIFIGKRCNSRFKYCFFTPRVTCSFVLLTLRFERGTMPMPFCCSGGLLISLNVDLMFLSISFTELNL